MVLVRTLLTELLLISAIVSCGAFLSPLQRTTSRLQHVNSLWVSTSEMSEEMQVQDAKKQDEEARSSLTQDLISKLRFRELRSELENRDLSTTGTTSQLRSRLVESEGLTEECVVNEDGMGGDCVEDAAVDKGMQKFVSFVDESDPDFEAKELLREIRDKSEKGHWKAATRKLKRMTRRYADHEVPEDVLVLVLEACMARRLQGARASEPARKILELMVEKGYHIPENTGNYCVRNCIDEKGPDSTHQGFGGLDTALAMMAALEMAKTPIQLETYDKVCCALAKEGSVDEALSLLRNVVADLSETPPLATFAAVARAAVARPKDNEEEKVLTLLAYAKAAGYELDSIASTEHGRLILAAGVVAAERMDNIALGLRLLTAANNANVEPDRGDNLVSSSSSAAQRASTLIHKRAINRAVEDEQWKLAVKLLELMLQRSLRPSPWVWRNVITCCAKKGMSRKATSLLLDWASLAENGKADKPGLSSFNTVMNVCEISNEQELTLRILDSMRKTHDTDGNIITFNIALKRLAKQGNYEACEGMIIAMLQANIEPTVVSYTTAIAACASDESGKQPTIAYEWLKRMRSRRVSPNVLTYNTALATCLDGTLESAVLGSKIASDILADVEVQLEDNQGVDEYTNVIPDASTKFMARRLIEQVDAAVEAGEMDGRVAAESVKIPLIKLSKFMAPDTNKSTTKHLSMEEDQISATSRDEMELEYSTANQVHRIAEV